VAQAIRDRRDGPDRAETRKKHHDAAASFFRPRPADTWSRLTRQAPCACHPGSRIRRADYAATEEPGYRNRGTVLPRELENSLTHGDIQHPKAERGEDHGPTSVQGTALNFPVLCAWVSCFVGCVAGLSRYYL
jgi:hypothetical protein